MKRFETDETECNYMKLICNAPCNANVTDYRFFHILIHKFSTGVDNYFLRQHKDSLKVFHSFHISTTINAINTNTKAYKSIKKTNLKDQRKNKNNITAFLKKIHLNIDK
jgi:hypothetical protein